MTSLKTWMIRGCETRHRVSTSLTHSQILAQNNTQTFSLHDLEGFCFAVLDIEAHIEGLDAAKNAEPVPSPYSEEAGQKTHAPSCLGKQCSALGASNSA